MALDIVDVSVEVDDTGLERVEILNFEVFRVTTTVALNRAGGRDNDSDFRIEAADTRDDVEELLGAEVRAEASLGDDYIGGCQRGACRNDRVTAERDIGEGATVNKGRATFTRLDKIGARSLLE